MQQPYIIGVDIGTGSTKAVAVNAEGTVLLKTQEFYATHHESGKSEQDVWEVYRAFLQCMKSIAIALQQPPLAVSLSSAMHSLLVIDKEGNPLTAALLWSDTRSHQVAEALRSSELGKRLYLATGTPLHSMSPLCKIKWLLQNDAAVFAKASRFISIKEFIWAQLFGEYKIDYSLASATGLFDIHRLNWSEEALAFAEISANQLSVPVSPTYSKSGIKPSMAQAMGLQPDTTFFIGSSDGCLANLGSFCFDGSVAAITIGTSAAVRITSQLPLQHTEQMLFNYLLDARTFICGGAVNNGGNVVQWLLEKFFANQQQVRTYSQLFSMLQSVPPGSRGLLFLPYLHGERAPIWDEKSSGVFLGVRSFHTAADFARAVVEGVCFALRHILSSIEAISGPVQRIKLSGGLADEDVLVQMLADVTGRPVVTQQAGDASAIGAALLALQSLGLVKELAALEKPAMKTSEPQENASLLYQQYFAVYKDLYPALKEQLHLLQQLPHT